MADIDLEKLWRISQAHTASRFRGHPYLDELLSEASESFVKFANEFDDLCERHGYSSPDNALFYTLVKRRIGWDCLQYLERRAPRGEEGVEDQFGQPRSVLRIFNPDSLLHHQLADYVATLHLRERLYLALIVFEELPLTKIARLCGSADSVVHRAIHTAAERIQLHALRLTVDTALPQAAPQRPTKWQPPAEVVDRIRRAYGCDVETYLAYVQANYHADVSYIVEILDRANGRGPARGNAGNNRKLTDDQVQEIIARLRAGESHGDIAKDYGITRSGVTYLKKAHGVAA